jgi:hypothetical protein
MKPKANDHNGKKGQEFMEVETFEHQQPKSNNKHKQLHNILGAQSFRRATIVEVQTPCQLALQLEILGLGKQCQLALPLEILGLGEQCQLALPLEILGLGKQWFLMIVDYLTLFWH